jgi:hypothetical protein
MGESGYINWDMIAALPHWQPRREGQTYVYAFWLVDFDQSPNDDGIALLKRDGHPDWFLHADTADRLLSGSCPPGVMVSENYSAVFDEIGGRFRLKPLVASVLLGTSDVVYATADRSEYWTCGYWHLARRGKRIVRDLTMLYLRAVHIVTFLNMDPMNESTPEAAVGQATVLTASG